MKRMTRTMQLLNSQIWSSPKLLPTHHGTYGYIWAAAPILDLLVVYISFISKNILFSRVASSHRIPKEGGNKKRWGKYNIELPALLVSILFFTLLICRGVAMCKGGGPWPPQNFEIFLNIYIIILIFSKFSLKNKSWPSQIFDLVQWCS